MKTLLTLALFVTLTASAQDWAKARLEKSPRHHEWVKVKHSNREVDCFVVHPEVKDKAPAVVLIHEVHGLSDWMRSVADQLAEAGYIALAPDLLSGMGPGDGGTSSFEGRDAVTRAVSSLPADQVTTDLNAVVEYAGKLNAANGKVAVAGFGWGGAQSFRLATNNRNIQAALVFYGSGPDQDDAIARIQVPVYGFYGSDDARLNATIPKSTALMKKARKTYEPVTYDGAGHGFLRAGEDPQGSPGNKKARDTAWVRIKEILKKI